LGIIIATTAKQIIKLKIPEANQKASNQRKVGLILNAKKEKK